MKKVVYILSLILMFASSASAVDLSESFGEKTIEEKLAIYKKINENFPESKMEELMASLIQKNSDIFIERWRKAEVKPRPLFVSK